LTSCGLLAAFEDLSLGVLIKDRDDARSVGLRVFGIDIILECLGIGGDDGFVGVGSRSGLGGGCLSWRQTVCLSLGIHLQSGNTLAIRSGLLYLKAGF
jgi:hypothetical protein